MKITAMPICPIHHRRNAKTPIEPVFFKGWSFEHLVFAPLSQPKKPAIYREARYQLGLISATSANCTLGKCACGALGFLGFLGFCKIQCFVR
jgi:hypothetical protein